MQPFLRRTLKTAALLLAVCLLPMLPTAAGEDVNSINKDRFVRAAKFNLFDFEPGGDEFESNDFDGNGWPDYWQKIVDDTNKSYLANEISIVADPTRPGRLPGEPGHVLRIPFDGTGVAVRTRVPVEINPDMAYELSVWARSLRLERSIARLTLRWVNLDGDGAENILAENDLTVPPGQLDWTESPLRLRVNNVPPRATHLIILLSVYNNPAIPGSDRDGFVWFDDIRIFSRPKIFMAPTFRDYVPGVPDDPTPPPVDFVINYKGLIDNIPVNQRAGGAVKQYYRLVEISDIFGNAPQDRTGKSLALGIEMRKAIYPGTLTTYQEKLNVNLERLGVYYLTVTLYGYGGERLAERTQVLGLWLPPLRRKMGIDEAASAGGFGVVIEKLPEEVLRQEGTLAGIVERTGAHYVKSLVWPDKAAEGEIGPFLTSLSREFGLMRRSGVRITAMLSPPETVIGTQELYNLMKTRPEMMSPYTERVTHEFDSHIENWQWGGERERSFSFGVNAEEITGALKLLAGRTSSPAQSFAVALDAINTKLPSVEVAYAATLLVPEFFTPDRMLKEFVRLMPQYFSIFRQLERRLYPPKWLYDMSPQPEVVDETRQPKRKLEEWVTIALKPSVQEAHNPRLERLMLDDMTRKLVLTRMTDVPRAYVTPLIDPAAGLARLDVDGNPVPMPALLGLRVIGEYLNGATYLGSFILRNQHGEFPNFVFAHPNGKDALCVVWLEGGKSEEAELDFGGGYRLNLVDMQGNITPLAADTRFIATKTPQIITGMSIPFVRTRMSIRILPAPTLKMLSIAQRQFLTITNFYDQSISGEISINYAAREDFEYEPNWNVEPQKIRFDIGRPRRGEPRDMVLEYQIRPPDSSPVDSSKEYGEKLVSLRVVMMSDRPQVLRLVRKTDLTGDIRLTIRRLTNPDEQGVDIVQMKVRWIPSKDEPHKSEIMLRPYFRKTSELETLLPTVLVPAYLPGDEETPPVSIEYRIPREPRTPETWIGYRQEDGARFFNYNASQLVGPMVE